MKPANALKHIAAQLSTQVSQLKFEPPVTHVYNPLEYAWGAYSKYLELHGNSRKRVIFMGMNPGPWGMAQTGVPFGEVSLVRDWVGVDVPVGKPDPEHPKRPIVGFACEKSEVSGRRLWGYFKERFETAEAFFEDHFVANYCPLVLMGETGKNITPDKLPGAELAPLQTLCDEHLVRVVEALRPDWLIGVGGFAEARAKAVFLDRDLELRIGRVLHPSPASPVANRGWAEQAEKQLLELGIWE
ncbi:MAG: single-stranded DNA-binding protein [Pirellulales bacterium]|nr:single-stranded DNA-binding protein [Pirellulales bacterium]